MKAEWRFDPAYRESEDRVAHVQPALRTRFRHRAVRRARKLNALLVARRLPFYRWAVRPDRGRWVVVALQNYAVPNYHRDPRE